MRCVPLLIATWTALHLAPPVLAAPPTPAPAGQPGADDDAPPTAADEALPAPLTPADEARSAPMPVLVRVGDERGEEIWTRVGGQTVDLDVRITRVPDRGERGVAEQIAIAAALAQDHEARVVVWFRPLRRGEGVIVYVAEPAADRVFVRRLPLPHAGADARSALAEAAALVVRAALQALREGTPIGVSAREVVREHEAPEPAPAPPPDQSPRSDPPPPASSSPGLGPLLALGWRAARDGVQPYGHHGAAARAGVTRGPWSGSILLALHPAAQLRDAYTTLRLTRYGAAVGVTRRWPVGPVGVALGLDIGVALFAREADPRADGVMVTAATLTPALHLSPRLGLLVPIAAGPALFLELDLTLDALVGAPAFAYERAGRTEVRAAVDAVHAGVFAGLRWQP
ncbi:hypothetical protein [Haliangium sp.]|uniref:hypothetical protein n=1 Tax=Haliangium sp. TaxID=2663208 RepID=UPI003D0F00B3